MIKQKRCGKINGRTVADGRKQQDLYTKAEVSSPALSLEGFLASSTIDALEGQHIAIDDVTEAFLRADMHDFVVVKMQGPAVDALLNINKLKYQPFISQTKSNNKIIYVQLKKQCTEH